MTSQTIHLTIDDANLGDSVIYKPRIMHLLHNALREAYPDAEIRVTSADPSSGNEIHLSDESLRDEVGALRAKVLEGAYGDWREPPLRLGIAENGTWAATALYDGKRLDCPVTLGGDPALSARACAEIEDRLAAGKASGTVRMEDFEWEYELVEEG